MWSQLIAHLSVSALLCLAAFVAGPTWAAEDAALRQDLRDCLEIPSALRRLDCFDRLAREVARDSLERPGISSAPATGGPEGNRRDGRDAPGPSDPMVSTIVRLEQRPRGEWVFYLANGQIWTEIEPGRTRYETDSDVRITRTLFGSHMLSVEGARATRVRRIN